MTDQKITVVVVDDHPSYSKGLAMLLAATDEDIEVVATATDHDEAISAVGTHLPDLVLVDIHMPGTNGIEITKKIRHMFPVVRVAMLTVSEIEAHVVEALRCGASGFLLKDMEVEELASTIHAIHDGQVVVSPSIAGKLLATPPEGDPLSDSDCQLLKLVAEGLENGEIARIMSMSESTLKRSLRNILEKLQVHTRIEAAVYAAKRGLI